MKHLPMWIMLILWVLFLIGFLRWVSKVNKTTPEIEKEIERNRLGYQ